MNFPSEQDSSRSAQKKRQRAYLASLDAQVSAQARQSAVDKRLDGHFVRELPQTPDYGAVSDLLLKPLPPVGRGGG